VKDPDRAIVPRRRPKTWPLLVWRGWDDLSPATLLWVVAATLAVLVTVAVALR
jgi:hypothetical protein